MISPILIPILGVCIPLVALIGTLIVKPLIALRERQMELNATMVAEKAAQYAAQTERLEQRVQVLERILTDRGTHVAAEIEALRERPLN
jgi:superfamily II DNA helicase RecQ